MPSTPEALQKQKLIQNIQAEITACQRDLGFAVLNPNISQALLNVPREAFVPAEYREAAYDNRPLPIGQGQTISQPFIVAIMTQMLAPKPTDRVLEIGTGSGYQAAVLALLVKHIYSIEFDPELASQATIRLKRLNIHNVSVRQGDGFYGWAEAGPFDSIVITAAATRVAEPLIAQLKTGGRLVMPLGGTGSNQQLCVYHKTGASELKCRHTLSVVFVPFRGHIQSRVNEMGID